MERESVDGLPQTDDNLPPMSPLRGASQPQMTVAA
jgi:hypothetical protein